MLVLMVAVVMVSVAPIMRMAVTGAIGMDMLVALVKLWILMMGMFAVMMAVLVAVPRAVFMYVSVTVAMLMLMVVPMAVTVAGTIGMSVLMLVEMIVIVGEIAHGGLLSGLKIDDRRAGLAGTSAMSAH
jgi:hypothetical protein